MIYDNPFFTPKDEEQQSWRSALVNTLEALFMLLLGVIGNELL